jgi:hypothetical protein
MAGENRIVVAAMFMLLVRSATLTVRVAMLAGCGHALVVTPDGSVNTHIVPSGKVPVQSLPLESCPGLPSLCVFSGAFLLSKRRPPLGPPAFDSPDFPPIAANFSVSPLAPAAHARIAVNVRVAVGPPGAYFGSAVALVPGSALYTLHNFFDVSPPPVSAVFMPQHLQPVPPLLNMKNDPQEESDITFVAHAVAVAAPLKDFVSPPHVGHALLP